MREDMSRVIVERPRYGGGRARKGRARPPEDLPKHEGMRRPHKLSGDWKMLNENLSPLRRFLERQVGRPWDKVYSEIARHLRVDSTVQQHVRDHLDDFVAVKRRHDRLWQPPLYVDPKDGLLKRAKQPAVMAGRSVHQGQPESPDRVALAPDRELRRIDGLWYEVMLAPLPEPEYRTVAELRRLPLKRFDRTSPVVEVEMKVRRLLTPAVRDVASGAAILAGPEIDDEPSWKEYRRAYPDRRYAVRKRALSRAELKRHGLRNLAPED